jgi:mono/diheme cytochrome c family protein
VLGGVLLGLALLVQLIPVGAGRTNPPVVAEPQWDSPRTEELFTRACADCHSNRTRWPWYSRVAPVSWLVASDVENGRRHLNVSEWQREQKHAPDAADEVRDGEMPLPLYRVAHAQARLSEAEKAELVAGLEATFGTEDEGGRRRRGQRDEEPLPKRR